MRFTEIVLATFLLGAVVLQADESASQYAEITVEPLPGLPSRAWGPEHQHLQADKQGRVFLLRKDTLGLYQISAGGDLVSKGRLVRDDSVELQRNVQGVALSAAGDAWILLSSPNLLYVFQGDQMKVLEAPWHVTAVLANGGEPLVAVMPGEMSTAAPSILRLKNPPLLLQYDGKRWNTLAEGRFPGSSPEGVGYLDRLWGEYNVFLGLSPERRLWMADEFAYRLRRFSPSYVVEDELTLGEAKIEWNERPKEEREAVERLARKGGLSSRSLSGVRPEPVVRAMTVGRDGAVYLLVRTDQGLALDRFHPALLSLSRVLLKGIELASWAKPTMALGTQGLLIAPLNARDGIWQIDAETLDQADWRPVIGAKLNGQALLPAKALPTEPEADKEAPAGARRVPSA